MKRIVTFGPGPKFKGGIANYNTSLAKAFDHMENTEVHVISWTQQYPAIIPRDFIDRKSRKDQLEGTHIQVHYVTNYNDPSTWKKTYSLILKLSPDIVVFQWAIAIQGIPMGYIAKKLKKHKDISVVFDLHFVIQKEGSKIDERFTKMGIKHADRYVVHALKTANELRDLFPKKDLKITRLYHPVYDMFQPDPFFDITKHKKELGLNKHVFLFFGFIRKYKGLHHVIKAFAELLKERKDISLLIVGESFWQTLDNKKWSTRIKNFLFGFAKKIFLKKGEDEREYYPLALIDEYGIQDYVYSYNEFVPNEDVHKYFQMSDAIMLFYEYATPSGVESIAYNFRLPMLATNVGHFPETIREGYNGYLAEAGNIASMSLAMNNVIEKPIPRDNIEATAREMSWDNYAKAILTDHDHQK